MLKKTETLIIRKAVVLFRTNAFKQRHCVCHICHIYVHVGKLYIE